MLRREFQGLSLGFLATFTFLSGWETSSPLFAAEPQFSIRTNCFGTPSSPADLFVARDNGLIEVQYRPQNERLAQVRIRNVSGAPLSIQMPNAFAARPILAQFFPPPNNQGSNNNRSAPQSTAGGSPSNGPNTRPIIFNIPAERLVEFKVETVCLDHGAPTPNSSMRYELVPLSEVLDDPAALEPVLIALGKGECSQRVAQAAAWHLSPRSGEMSWDALAKKSGELTTVGRQPYFSQADLKRAQKLVASRNATNGELQRSLLSDEKGTAAAKKLPKL